MSTLGETFAFFERLGVYEILLPFLLVFTIVFAILEKSAILGFDTDKDGKYKMTKKNQNSMIAFVTAFIVTASAEVVRVMNRIIADTIILLVLALCFLMLIGIFHKQEKDGFFLNPENKHQKWMYYTFMVFMIVGIFFIFLNAVGWLDLIMYYLTEGFTAATTGSVIVILVFLGIILFVTQGGPRAPIEGKGGD
jgi:hypothetical protein